MALYFGAVGITKTRYAISYGLRADLAGVVAAIFVAYLFFSIDMPRRAATVAGLPDFFTYESCVPWHTK